MDTAAPPATSVHSAHQHARRDIAAGEVSPGRAAMCAKHRAKKLWAKIVSSPTFIVTVDHE